MSYDKSNVFARILRGEIPSTPVYEDDHALAFADMHPAAPVHVLVIPKGEFVSFNDFTQHASPELLRGFWKAVQNTASQLGLDEGGYRLITNHGPDAEQSVHHFHVHILGGKSLGKLLPQ